MTMKQTFISFFFHGIIHVCVYFSPGTLSFSSSSPPQQDIVKSYHGLSYLCQYWPLWGFALIFPSLPPFKQGLRY